jgi:hypothetical protein
VESDATNNVVLQDVINDMNEMAVDPPVKKRKVKGKPAEVIDLTRDSNGGVLIQMPAEKLESAVPATKRTTRKAKKQADAEVDESASEVTIVTSNNSSEASASTQPSPKCGAVKVSKVKCKKAKTVAKTKMSKKEVAPEDVPAHGKPSFEQFKSYIQTLPILLPPAVDASIPKVRKPVSLT